MASMTPGQKGDMEVRDRRRRGAATLRIESSLQKSGELAVTPFSYPCTAHGAVVNIKMKIERFLTVK
ncbi:hypothetical protein TRIUR3_08098 [Triticum urartu]|uniref:Uncharacterized protein n=1 Tax=Triticum urartu TaxID=4572 RepID=M7ZY81_TRIUA|nr:hypothetical protein TRIUR3_08098 [Triticum urartu]